MFCYYKLVIINDEYNKVEEFAKVNRIHEWVLSFLRSSGNNLALANTLETYSNLVHGPIDYPIGKLLNIIGPDESYKYVEMEEILAERVARMIKDLGNGWKAPPLIATNIWNNHFELADGGHRQRALLKTGLIKYPTIFYFRDRSTMHIFLSQMDSG